MKALAPEVPVYGRVVFLGLAEFPKGMSEGVSSLATLEQDWARISKSPVDNKAISSAWLRIKAAARRDEEAGRDHLRQLQHKHGKSLRRPVGLAMVASGLALAGGLLLS